MKEETMKAEVRSAVREYVDQLLAERSGPGKGMAVSNTQLLAAAKTAGQKVNQAGANEFLDSFVRPGLQLLKEVDHKQAPTQPQRHSQRQNSLEARITNGLPTERRVRSVPPPGAKRKPATNKEYHWMVWKTGRTPTPAPRRAAETPRPPSMLRAETPVLLRAETPVPLLRAETPAVALRAQTPAAALRSETPAVAAAVARRGATATPAFICRTPAPPSPDIPLDIPSQDPLRPPTALNKVDHEYPYHRIPTPEEVKTEEPIPYQRADDTGMNALKSWVSNANEYERDVAYNLLRSINGGSASPTKQRERMRARNATTLALRRAQAQNVRPKTAGVRTCIPAWTQEYSNPYQDQHIYDLMTQQTLDGQVFKQKTPVQSNAPPMARHLRQPPSAKGYTHEGSFFMNSGVPYHSNFIVNPEWVSEHVTRKRQTRQLGATKGSHPLTSSYQY